MKNQRDIFSESEGDQYFERNNLPGDTTEMREDKVIQVLKSIQLSPEKVLEIGCSKGNRLNQIRNAFGCRSFGIDPSPKAIRTGSDLYPDISLKVGTADKLDFEDQSFDMIIFGFCLYLCDRKDLFRIACEADRCLKDSGSIVIKDFYPPFPYKNPYSHFEGVFSYKMDYSKMFKWNPAYTEVANVVFSHASVKFCDDPDEKIGVVVLRKNEQVAYVEHPFR